MGNSDPHAGKAAAVAAREKAIRDRIAAGKTSAALKDAKDFAKQHAGPTADAVLADAYAARFQDLSRSRQDKEASELLKVALHRFPALASRWQQLERSQQVRTGDLSGLVAVLINPEAPDTERAAAEAELQRELLDPRALLQCGLPADHELHLAASAVTLAFEEVALGTLSAQTREGLRHVGRRSPLAPWRSFVLALTAFHRNADTEANDWLSRIPDDAGPAPFAAVLKDSLAGRAPTTDLGTLLDGGITKARELAIKLRRALEVQQKSQTSKLAIELLEALHPLDQRLAARFLRYVDQVPEDLIDIDSTWMATAERLFADGELPRLYAADFSAQDPLVGITHYVVWLCRDHGKAFRPISDQDLARVLDRLADTAAQAFAEIGQVAFRAGFGSSICLERTEAVQFGRTLYELHGPGSEGEAAADALIHMASLMSCLQRRLQTRFEERAELDLLQDLLPDIRREQDPRGWLLLAGCLLTPTAERYQRLVRAWSWRDVEEVFKIVKHWVKVLPSAQAHSVAAHFHLSQGDPDAAATSIEAALRLDPLHTLARAMLGVIAAQRIRAAIERDDTAKAQALIEELLAKPAARGGPIRDWCKAALAIVQGKADPDPEIRDFVVADLNKRPEEVAQRLQVPGSDRKSRIRILLRWLALDVAMDSRLKETIDEAPFDPWTETDLPTSSEDQKAVCQFLMDRNLHEASYLTSGVGLRTEGPLLPFFLCCRLLAVAEVRGAEAAKDLVPLAYSASVQRGQPEVFARIARRLPRQLQDAMPDEPLEDDQFRSELSRERQRGTDLSARIDPRPEASTTETLDAAPTNDTESAS